MATPLVVDDKGLVATCRHCGQRNRVAFDRLAREARCGQCHEPIEAGTAPLEVGSTADFDRLVSRSAVPVVVDYWAPWCGPCRMVAPELEKVAQRAGGRFLVVKVNTDVLTDLGERHRIMSIPTLAIFSGGREVQRAAGARPAADIEAFIAASVS
ncbi:MAG: thioredoxin [Vicinamibacterales bacterium]